MKIWQSVNLFTLLLAPLSLLFWLISLVRRALYRYHFLVSYRSPVPVLIVGNLSVGGNGKTPVVVWLVEQLQQRGIKVGVISRGYGGQNKQFPQLVLPNSSAEQFGDEPVLIAKRTSAPVAISPNRWQSIKLLLTHHQLDLIVADDGLQHYALQRDLEWVVIDGERRFGNGFVLPAGSLRELPSRLNHVQGIICNGGDAKANEQLMQLAPSYAVNVKTGEKQPLNYFSQSKNVAMAGIGYPPRFFTMLEKLRIPLIACHAFADHQPFTEQVLTDLCQGEQNLLMTEKDAVKCTEFAHPNWWYIPISAQFSQESTEALLTPVLNLIKQAQSQTPEH